MNYLLLTIGYLRRPQAPNPSPLRRVVFLSDPSIVVPPLRFGALLKSRLC